MNIAEHIESLMRERNWSAYMLSKLSGLDPGAVRKYLARETEPSLTSLEAMCNAFGISMAQFFLEGDLVSLTDEQRQLLTQWSRLTSVQKQLLLELMKNINN